MDNGPFATTEELITLPELFKRWCGITDNELLIEESKGSLLPYYREKSVILNNGKIQHWLYNSKIPYDTDFGIEYINKIDRNCVFLISNINKIEKERPDFLCKRVDIDIQSDDENGMNEDIDTLRTRIAELEAENAALQEQASADNTSKVNKVDRQATALSAVKGYHKFRHWYDRLTEDSQQKKYGVSEAEWTPYFMDGGKPVDGLTRDLIRDLKRSLPAMGIRIWGGKGARPST